ncbi:P-loop containing nucleoside triphosphate hydrolase protein [Neocallimastix lanati (nom. inval.)]|nr:P-loop containing nucleoside triphosphate hydrolase protein [Neocallimastix sp. JGI-2020a]
MNKSLKMDIKMNKSLKMDIKNMSNSYEYIKLNNIESLSENFNDEDLNQLPLRTDCSIITKDKDEKAMKKNNNTQDNQKNNYYHFGELSSTYLDNKEWNKTINESFYHECNNEELNNFHCSKDINSTEEGNDDVNSTEEESDDDNNVKLINKTYSAVLEKLKEYNNYNNAYSKQLLPKIQDLKVSMNKLQRILNNNRYPLIALIGRRGCGKSSCINAIVGQRIAEQGHVKSQTGQAKILQYRDHNGCGIDVLDTRGINEGQRPKEDDVANKAEDSIISALKQVPVDCILYLHKAKELDSGIESDLKVLNEIIVKCNFEIKIPIIGVITQCDELDPCDIKKPTEYDEEKLNNIAEAKKLLKSQLEKFAPDLNDYVVGIEAISSYIRWKKEPDENGAILPMRDYRYNMDNLMNLFMKNVNIKALFKTAQVCKIQNIKIKFANMIVKVILII